MIRLAPKTGLCLHDAVPFSGMTGAVGTPALVEYSESATKPFTQ
jgi:hypothetical protein